MKPIAFGGKTPLTSLALRHGRVSARDEAYRLWRQDPSHPGLYFKQVQARRVTYYSVRVGLHYRALARSEPDGVVWFWIGTHTEYDKLLG